MPIHDPALYAQMIDLIYRADRTATQVLVDERGAYERQRAIVDHYHAQIRAFMPWLNRLEHFYPPKFLVERDGVACWVRIGVSAAEVGMHWLRENGYINPVIWPE